MHRSNHLSYPAALTLIITQTLQFIQVSKVSCILFQGEGRMPCTTCGACCACFRVAFYWREEVPPAFTEDQDPFRKVMKGTSQKYGRKCQALKGRIGESVKCTIYEKRPSVCRAFSPYTERCDLAREQHGLKPLKRPSTERYDKDEARHEVWQEPWSDIQ